MKKLIKVKNRIYRRYLGDLWGEVILKGKLTRIFRFLLRVYELSLKSLYLKKTRSILLRKKFFFLRKLKSQHNFLFTLSSRLKLSGGMNMRSDTYFNRVNEWRTLFWLHFNNFYFKNKIFKPGLKKTILPFYLKTIRKSLRTKFFRSKYLWQAVKNSMTKDTWRRRRGRSLFKWSSGIITERMRIRKYSSWLECDYKFKLDRKSHWWVIRTFLRKLSIFYGIKNLRKFRYINYFSTKAMSLRSYFVVRLETMLNIILFRMNLFSNTYFANNFVKVGGVFINNKNVRYPYRFMNFNDILMINKRFFKKIFNSFFKKLSLSRVLLKKRNKFYIYCKLNRPKLILNAPKYLQINYKILHAILWRLPRKKEIVGPYSHPVTSIHEWAISTRVEYN